ncbi:MAG TPA: hypothetical protein VGD95_06135 [Micavibrio sp.]
MKNLVVALLALFLSVQTALAQSQPIWPEEIVLDGVKFNRSDLNGAFAESVFTKDMMNDHKGRPNLDITQRYSSLTDPENIKREYPWLYEHIYPSDGLPKLLSVSKWNKPVRITFGMPNDIRPYAKPEDSRNEEFTMEGKGREYMEAYRSGPLIQSLVPSVKNISDQLSKLTGLNISYLAHEQETKENLAEIRVNIQSLSRNKPENHFKMERGYDYGLSSYGPNNVPFHGGYAENAIKTGFVFTATSRQQVDGYILTNAKNEIVMAVCYIWNGHEPDMIKKLVHEYILRSLGLPGGIPIVTGSKPKSYLTYWNDSDVWGEDESQKPPQPEGISEFDQFMIKTLYNPALKPGMDYVEAQKILLGLQ